MEARNQSPFSSFKSKKKLHSDAPLDQEGQKVSAPPPTTSNPCSVKTPGKAVDPPRRLRHRSAAMSIKEVRQAALALREKGSEKPPQIDSELRSEKVSISRCKKKIVESETMLPEKYELLEKFFNSLDSSIRLLQLKGCSTIFSNISPQIERLTDRRFSYCHLAQLKFLMPEAIVIEKVLQRDERTSCMKPDLRITLNVEAIGNQSKSKSSSTNLQMRKVFHERLLDFSRSHPEVDEVPEEVLPAPFNKSKENLTSDSIQSSVSSADVQDVTLLGRPAAASHLSRSFKKSFSKSFSECRSVNCIESIKQGGESLVSVHTSDSELRISGCPSEKETIAFDDTHSTLSLKPSSKEACLEKASSSIALLSSLPETPVKVDTSSKEEDANLVLRTPVDHASTPARLMSATPVLRPPKRCHMSPDDASSRSPNKLARRPPPNRPLKFDTPVKSVKKVDDEISRSRISSTDDDVYDILPEDLLQSIQEKERLALTEKDPAISQAKWRKKMIASLPKLFDMINYLFQLMKRSVVTKEELIQKIMTGHLDIVDRREIEEQLRLLQKLAPEWISEKSGICGDCLICVNKISCTESIRSRLLEAE